MSVVREIRHLAGGVKRRLRPSPEEAARRRFEEEAAHVPRHTRGRVRLMHLDVEYADARSTVPQWDDLFVRRSLAFTAASPAPRVLDCGANIGLATLWLLAEFPDARITAFEPDPDVARILARNLEVNGAGGVDLVRAAAWSSAGTLRFHPDGADSGAVEPVAGSRSTAIEVPAVRLRDWIAREPIDLLKLDVEGAELEILGDCADVLGRVRALQVEVHDLDPACRRLPACLDLLDRAGFAYTLADLHQASWRESAPPAGPFPGVATWVVTVRAWPRS